jgi:hypothetical protein
MHIGFSNYIVHGYRSYKMPTCCTTNEKDGQLENAGGHTRADNTRDNLHPGNVRKRPTLIVPCIEHSIDDADCWRRQCGAMSPLSLDSSGI